MEKIEDLCMELGSLLTEGVYDVKLAELSAKIRQMKGLFDKVSDARSEWLAEVQKEVARQNSELESAFASDGLTAPSKPTKGAKRGPKPKNKDAQTNAENEAVAFEEDELASGNSALLDAE